MALTMGMTICMAIIKTTATSMKMALSTGMAMTVAVTKGMAVGKQWFRV